MIRYAQGNLLEAHAEAFVNTVNTVGVSGKGIALMFKENFPENFKAYEAASKAGIIEPGGLFVTERDDMLSPRYIINFATKKHWRNPSRLEWIKTGLISLRTEIAERDIRSIAIPPLGAGNGGLDWRDVKPFIADALEGIDCDIIVYEPTQAYHNVVKRHGVEKLTPARALMAEIIRRYEVLGFDCSLLEAQKLAWFVTGSIRHLNLKSQFSEDFTANHYGPYSDGLRHLLDSLDGSYLTCERRVADAKPLDPIRFRHDRRDKIQAYLTSPEASIYRPALDRATAIIDGFQSPYGLELLATADWLNQNEGAMLDADDMMRAIAAWPGPKGSAERKAKIFSREHVKVAVDHLSAIQIASASA